MKREIAVCLMLLMASCLLSGVTYADLDDGLVAYYPFEFNTQDASGNEYHCSTPNQELNYVPGAIPDGYAVQVDENYGVIEPAPPISSAFTVSFWLNTDTILGQQGMSPEGGTIYTTQPWGEYKGFGIRRDLNALSVFINKGSQTERRLFTSVGFIEPYTWYFIIVTYDGSTLRAFSVNEGTITTVMSEQFEGFIPYNNKAVLFRHHTTSREQDFKGKMDDFRLYNRALTEAEILELFYSVNHVEMEVPLDIKPNSCPNPINVKSKGKLPVAIIGTGDFDVMEVDIASVRIEGVTPTRSASEDVATPFEPFTGKKDCAVDCTDLGSDGFLDLILKFSTQEIVATFGNVEDGECLVLKLTGNLKDEFGGIPITGEDVVVIVGSQIK